MSERTPWRRPRGLGDIVASVAQPIAKTVDAVFGTKVQHCGSCKERQAELNEKFPIPRKRN